MLEELGLGWDPVRAVGALASAGFERLPVRPPHQIELEALCQFPESSSRSSPRNVSSVTDCVNTKSRIGW